jgi:Amt family ammonium transporter
MGSILLGAVAGVLCALAVGLKYRLGYDDSLDVVGVHMVGGLVGTIGVGFLATAAAPAGVDGLFYGGGFDQLWRQVVGALAVLVFSFGMTYVIGTVLHKAMGFRITEDDEVSGIDLAVHAETGYDLHLTASGARAGVLAAVGAVASESRHSAPAGTQPGQQASADQADQNPGEKAPGEKKPGEKRVNA